VKAPELKSSNPGQKDSPFPAWLLRYAAQAAPSLAGKPPVLDPEKADEKDFTELDHFEEVQSPEPEAPQASADQPSAE